MQSIAATENSHPDLSVILKVHVRLLVQQSTVLFAATVHAPRQATREKLRLHEAQEPEMTERGPISSDGQKMGLNAFMPYFVPTIQAKLIEIHGFVPVLYERLHQVDHNQT
jgi:hypothetical protein